MSIVLTNVGLVVTQGLAWCGDVIDVVEAQPLIQLFVLLPLVGLGIGFLKRLIRI